jgi:hypothetical protein
MIFYKSILIILNIYVSLPTVLNNQNQIVELATIDFLVVLANAKTILKVTLQFIWSDSVLNGVVLFQAFDRI